MAESPSTGAEFPQLKPLGQHADKPAIRIHRPVFMIGSRHSAHLHLLSRQVSKAHAVILKDDQGLYVRDLCSRTHLFVNNQPVSEAWLKDGDQIKIGPFSFRLLANGFDKGTHRPLPPGQLQPLDQIEPIALKERVTLIGRREECAIPVADPTVSAEHAIIFAMGGKWHARDLGSRGGTFVNGQQIHQKTLDAGDALRVGPLEIRFSPVREAVETSLEDVAGIEQELAQGLGAASVQTTAVEEQPIEVAPASVDEVAVEPEGATVQPVEAQAETKAEEEAPVVDAAAAPVSDALIEPAIDSVQPLDLEPLDLEPVADEAVTEDVPPSPAKVPPDLIRLDSEADAPLLIDGDLPGNKLSSSATGGEPQAKPVEPPDDAADRAADRQPLTLTQPLPEPPVALPEASEAHHDEEQGGIALEPEAEPPADTLSRRGWRRPETDEPPVELPPEAGAEAAAVEAMTPPVAEGEDEAVVEAVAPTEAVDLPAVPVETAPPSDQKIIDLEPLDLSSLDLDSALSEPPSQDVELESPVLESQSPSIELESPLLEPPSPQEMELQSPLLEAPVIDAPAEATEPVATPTQPQIQTPTPTLEAESAEALPPLQPDSDAPATVAELMPEADLLEPDVEAPPAAGRVEESAEPAPLQLDEFDSELSPLEPSQESMSGELDFSNLTLDPDEAPPAGAPGESGLGLELIEPPPSESPQPSAARAEEESPEGLSLIPLDAVENAQDGKQPAADEIAPQEPSSQAEAAAAPVEAPQPKPRRKGPRRGPDGKFLKRSAAEELPAEASIAAAPPGPVEAAGEVQVEGLEVLDEPGASAADASATAAAPARPATPAKDAAPAQAGGDPRSLMGLGVNQGGFFGGIPLGLEPPPRAKPAAAPVEQPAPQAPPPRMLHPFDWGAEAAAAGGKVHIPAYREPRGGVRSTGFDGLAMPPVREADVFSQMPIASDAAVDIPFDEPSAAPAQLYPTAPPEKSSKRPVPLDPMQWRPPPPPAPPRAPSRKRRWFGFSLLLVLMLLCMAGAAGGIWQFMRPQSLVQGLLPFVGPRPTLGQQHQQVDLLRNTSIQDAARRIVQQEHLDGGFLNNAPAFSQLAVNAQWSADGLMISRTTSDARGDQQRMAAVLSAMYHAADNQALIDQHANLVRHVETLKTSEADAKDALRDLDRAIKALEDTPPPMPTEQQRADIQQRLTQLKHAWESGAAGGSPVAALADNWLIESFIPRQAEAATSSAPAGSGTDVQTQYLRTLVAQQNMDSQVAAGERYERRLRDMRDQRRTAQLAVQHAAEARVAAEEKASAAIAPGAPSQPTAIALQDPRQTYIALCLAGIAAVFLFLMGLTLFVGRSPAPAGAWERPQPVPQPRPADDLFAHELANPEVPSAVPASPIADRQPTNPKEHV